jgi:hypothetical protein
MKPDRLQLQRHELKYAITESVAQMARDFVRAHLVLDENGVENPLLSYAVHSIYLDSHDFKLCQQTLSGEKNRYKLRMRFYDDSPESPVFLEIKRRENNAIQKQRCPVTRQAADTILQGQFPMRSEILSSNPKHLKALEQFLLHVCELRAKPSGHVAYLREAWISAHDDSVRVTMDRHVRYDADPSARFSTELKSPVHVFGDKVILEIKFTTRFPAWFGDFVRHFGLVQESAAKYAHGVVTHREHRRGNLPRDIQPLQNIA